MKRFVSYFLNIVDCFCQDLNSAPLCRQILPAQLAILDIMGVNGLELLKIAVERGIPTVMLTAHALTPDVLKKSMKLGAVSFLPKEKMSDLQEFLEEVVLGGGKPIWAKFFDHLGTYFDTRFGPDWKEKDKFFGEFEKAVRGNTKG